MTANLIAGSALSSSRTWSWRNGYALALLTLIYALNGADRQLLGLVLPMVKADLHLSDAQLGLATGAAFVVAYGMLVMPVARLADWANRRNILAVCLTVWSLATFLTGAVSGVWHLVAGRFLLGVGESGVTAPSSSMLSDLFKGRARGIALSIFATSAPIAAVIMLPSFGYIAEAYGWRAAFYTAGFLGVVMAILLLTTVAEPVRSGEALDQPAPERAGTKETARFLAGSPSYMLVLIGGGFIGFTIFTGHAWNASFLSRVHHLNIVQIGLGLGIAKGVLGTAGTLAGGWLTEHFGRRGHHWRLLIPAIGCLAVFPAQMMYLFASGVPATLIGYGLVQFALGIHMGPILTICHYLARDSMRATATAGFMLVSFLFGQLLGPYLVGNLNDHLAATYGDAAIRYSLILVGLAAIVTGICWIVGSRWVVRDMLRAHPEGA